MASAVPPPYPIASGTNTVQVVPPAPGTYTLRIYDSTGALLAQTDPFTVLQHIPQTYTVSAADVASLSEAVSATLKPANGAADELAIGESVSVQIIFAGVASDTLTLTELAANNGSLLIQEVITLTETASANMKMISSASDALVLAEAAVGSTSGGGGGLLNVQFSITNQGATSITKPQVSLGHPIAPGDVPAGYKLALYDSTGTTQNANFQQDQETYWLQDGSLKFAALSFISPDTFTAGQKITYTLKAVPGTPNRTPNVSLSQMQSLMVANDIAWNFYGLDLGTDTYQVSTKYVLANFCKAAPGWNPILPTNAASAGGSNTLYFANTSNISVGLMVAGTNIPANTKVLAVTSSTCTLSNPLTGTGIANGLNVTFQYPLGGWQVIRSGPVCTEYLVWSYLQRTSDGSYHAWQRARVMSRVWGTSGPIEVATRLQRPNIYGAMPNATLGADNRTAQYSNLTHGSQIVHYWGDPNDPDNFTLTPSQFNVASSCLNLPASFSPVASGGPGVTFRSTGTLPAGMNSTTVYYPTYLKAQKGTAPSGTNPFGLMFSRLVVSWGLISTISYTTWTPSKTLAAGQHWYVVQNGYIYITTGTTGGTTAATGSGPTGNTEYQTDNNLQWWCAGVAFSTQGTGTITAQRTIGTWRASGVAGLTTTTQRVWIPGSSGAVQMTYTPNLDFNYLTTQSRAIPCYDQTLISQCSYMPGPVYPYRPNTPIMNAAGGAFFLADTGDGPADERIGYINPSSINSLFLQDDWNAMQYANTIGLLWDDYFLSADDERAGQPPVTNLGQNRSTTAPTTYPGMPPVNSKLNFIATGGVYGNPQWNGPGYGDNASGYVMNYAQFLDASHTPIPWYVPYLRTGDYLYYDIGRSQCANMLNTISNQLTRNLINTTGTNPNSGNNNFGGCVTGPNQQARSWGWLVRAIGCAWHVMPTSDPLHPYIYDSLNDSAAYLDVIKTLGTVQQQNMGWIPIVLATSSVAGSEFWMNAIMLLAASMEAWRGEFPQWKTFVSGYMVKQVPKLLDSAQGGCEGAADSQWFVVSDTTGANFGADFYQTPLAVWQATYPAENWTSATCTNHTGMLKGLSSGLTKWVPMTPPCPADGYWNMSRCACLMAGVGADVTLCTELNTRILTRISQVGTIGYFATPTASTVTNYVKWAMATPASHS